MKRAPAFVLAWAFLFLESALSQSRADWQADWEKAVKAAEKEGEVAFYTLGDGHRYVYEFQKKYPKIKVNLVPGREAIFFPGLRPKGEAGNIRRRGSHRQHVPLHTLSRQGAPAPKLGFHSSGGEG